MNTEALFLFLILLLGLILCSFLGGNCGTEAFTGNSQMTGVSGLGLKNNMNSSTSNGTNSTSSTTSSTTSNTGSSTPSTTGSSTPSGYDNYNHYNCLYYLNCFQKILH